MSVVALPRFETLYANDPNLMQSFNDPEDTSPHPGKTLFQGIADPILGFGRIIFNNSLDPLSYIGGSAMPAATECALHWCVQTLDTSIQNGVLNQTVVGVWSNNSALDTSDVYLQPDLSPETQVVSTNNTSYYVSPMSNLPLVKFLEGVFTATVKGVSLPGMGFTEQEILDLSSYSSDIAQALWYADDLHSLMNNLAARMTDALRNLYSDPASDASTLGNVYTTQTYVLVTWPWLILPVGLVLASCILLLAAVISSSRQQTIVWKSSSLALLFHGFAGGDGNGHGGYSVHRKQMELTAQEMQVRLAESPGGDMRLVRLERRSDKAESSHHVGVVEYIFR